MALPYGDVKDLYDTLYSAGVTTKPLPQWSDEMNRLTGTDIYSAGLHDNFIKSSSHALDKWLEASGLTDVGREFGRTVGESVGYGQAGADIGTSLPRGTLNFAPMLIPGVGWAATAARLGLTGALSGAETYTATDSPAAGLLSGVTAAALPKFADVAEQQVLKRLGGKLLEGPLADAEGNVVNRISRYFPETIPQRVGSYLGGQVAAAGAMGATDIGQELLAGEDVKNPFSAEFGLNLTLGQLPFAALHLATSGRGARPVDELEHALAVSKLAIDKKAISEELAKTPAINTIPDVTPPEQSNLELLKDTNIRLAQVRGEQVDLRDDTTIDPEERVRRLNLLSNEESELLRTQQQATGESILGNSIAPDTARTLITGHQVRATDKWRAVYVDDNIDNPEELRGKIVSYSTAYEPTPQKHETGATSYALPESQWRTVKTKEEWDARGRATPDSSQPELPAQPHVPTREELFGHVQDLTNAQTDLDAATTTAELHQAITKINDVRAQLNIPPLTDRQLARRRAVIEKSELVAQNEATKMAAKVEAENTKRRVEQLTKDEAARVSAQFEAGEGKTQGFSITKDVGLGHGEETPESQPLHDVVDDVAYTALQTPEAAKAFQDWGNSEEHDIKKDARDFVDLVGYTHAPLHEGMDLKGAAEMLNERSGTTGWDANEVKDFLNRPHVKIWNDRLDTGLRNLSAKAFTPARVSAGPNWFFALKPIETVKGLSKEGVMPVNRFRNSVSDRGSMSNEELGFYKQLVPEAFVGEGVDVRKLYKGLAEKGPVVEVRKLGVGESGADKARTQHELETLGYRPVDLPDGTVELQTLGGGSVAESDMQPNVRALFGQFLHAQRVTDSDQRTSYSFVSPKPESEMPGYVEGLVRVPTRGELYPHDEGLSPQENGINLENANVKYTGPHYGSEDVNVLSTYRAYEEKPENVTFVDNPGRRLDPNDKIVAQIESQGDWAQHLQKLRQNIKEAQRALKEAKTDDEAKRARTMLGAAQFRLDDFQKHPLLDVWVTLGQKALIQHAKSIGAKYVFVPDAETAMMTEGHDRNTYAPTVKDGFNKRNDALDWIDEQPENLQDRYEIQPARNDEQGNFVIVDLKQKAVRQDAGMRLHYDQTLPSAMEKLTGEKGENVELGLHKNANLSQAQTDMLGRGEQITGGSPVFRDTSGNPKTQITGRAYDISKLGGEFSLTDPSRMLDRNNLRDMILGKESPYEPKPEDQPAIDELGFASGEAMLKSLQDQTHVPFVAALAKDWGKLAPELIQRIFPGLYNMDKTAYAIRDHNGNVALKFHPALLGADPVSQTLWRAHEFAHGLTKVALDEPRNAKINDRITELREQVIAKLPKDLKAIYDKATKGNWYEKYQRGETTEDHLDPDVKKANIIYGLLNNDEFVAQGFSERDFQKHLQSQKLGGESWFQRFTGFVKELLGLGDRVTNTAFEKFLSLSDQLISRGNHVAGFQNFGERYYKGLGMSDQRAESYTKRGLGLVIDSGLEPLDARGIFDKLSLSPTQVKSGEYIKAQRGFDQMVREQGDDFTTHKAVLGEMGYGTHPTALDEFTHDMLEGKLSTDVLDMLPQQTQDLVFAKAKDYRDVLSGVKAAAAQSNEGFTNLADTKTIQRAATEASNMTKELLKTEKAYQAAVQHISAMRAIEPDVFMDRMLDPQMSPGFGWLGQGKDKEERVGALKKFFGTLAQLARSDPALAEYADRGFEMMKNIRDAHNNIMRVMGIDLGEKGNNLLTSKGLEEATKVVKNPKLNRALDLWMHADQKVANKEERGVTMLPVSHPEITKLLNGLSDADKTVVINARAKTVLMNKKIQAEDLRGRAEHAITMGALIPMRDGGLKPVQALDVARNMWEAVSANFQDPQQAAIANSKLQLVQSKTSEQGFNSLLKFTQNAVDTWKQFQKFYDENPAYATARRMERWLIRYKRGGKLVLDQGSSQKEVLEKAKGATIVEQPWDQFKGNEDGYVPPSLSEESFNRLQELHDNALQMLRPYTSEEGLQKFDEYISPTKQFAREQAARVGAIPGFQTPARLLSQGADELPWLWNQISHGERTATYWARQQFRAQAELHLNNPELAERPDYRDIIRTHRDSVLSPDPRIISEINKFTTTWYLSSLASPIINGFQTLTTLVPELTRMNGGRWVDSYRRWADAVKAISEHGVERKGWESPEMKKFMENSIKAGEVDYSMWDEDAATQDSVATRWKQLMRKDKVQTVGQNFSQGLGKVTTAGLWLFKQPEKFNRFAALYSGFKLARENGMNFDDAQTEAWRVNRAVNYGGGKINRPIGAFSGTGNFPRSLAMLGTNLQGYNLGIVGQLARYLKEGRFRPSDMKPGEVYAARKAATQMLGTQLALAGALGLPFVSGMVALLNSAFPDLEVNKKLHEGMAQLFGEDNASGNTMSDIAMTGLPSMLGWDMQSRLSMGNLVPGVNELNGFQPELLLGPPMSLAASYLNGLGRVAQGQPQGAEAFVPPGIKKLFQLVKNSGKAEDYAGRPLFDLSPGEKLGNVIGFQSKRVSDYNLAARIEKQSEDVSKRRVGQFHQQLAEDALKGNFGSIRQAIVNRAQDDKSYNPLDGVRAVAKAAEDLTFPRDLRREGTARQAPERVKLLRALGIESPSTSEMQRLEFRKQIEARLGLPSRPDAGEIQIARLVDEIRQKQPELTRSQASAMASQLVRRQRLQTLLPLQD